MEEIIKIENLCKEYKTYKRDTGILEILKAFSTDRLSLSLPSIQ